MFCIQASDLLLAFAQRHGVILTEILGKGECGGRSLPPKRENEGGGAKPPPV